MHFGLSVGFRLGVGGANGQTQCQVFVMRARQLDLNRDLELILWPYRVWHRLSYGGGVDLPAMGTHAEKPQSKCVFILRGQRHYTHQCGNKLRDHRRALYVQLQPKRSLESACNHSFQPNNPEIVLATPPAHTGVINVPAVEEPTPLPEPTPTKESYLTREGYHTVPSMIHIPAGQEPPQNVEISPHLDPGQMPEGGSYLTLNQYNHLPRGEVPGGFTVESFRTSSQIPPPVQYQPRLLCQRFDAHGPHMAQKVFTVTVSPKTKEEEKT